MTDPKNPSVTVVKHIAAPPEDVFTAWSSPEILQQWMGAGETDVKRVEMDFRVGGKYLIEMWGEHEGEQCGGDHHGEYIEIDPPNKLVFTWISSYTGEQPSRVSIEFVPYDGGTELRLTHDRLPTQEIADMHGTGWEIFADLLNAFIVSLAMGGLKIAYHQVSAKVRAAKSDASSTADT